MVASPKAKAPRRKVVGTVHFTVDFDGMTDRIREFWAEGKYALAVQACTEGFGLTREQAAQVINGRKRLAQDPNGRKGCDGILLDDTWSPRDAHFTFYPEGSCPVSAAECQRLFKENQQLREELEFAGLRYNDRENELQFELTKIRARVIEARLNLRPGGAQTTLESFVAAQSELDTRPTPKPDKTYESHWGWVLPDGKFYPCKNMMEHIWLADRLGKDERAAEASGWVKITKGIGGIYIISQWKPSQAQINTVFDWSRKSEARSHVFEDWLKRWENEP